MLLVVAVPAIVGAVPIGTRCSKSVLRTAGVNPPSSKAVTSENCDEGSYCPSDVGCELNSDQPFHNCTAFILPGQKCEGKLPNSPYFAISGMTCFGWSGLPSAPCISGNFCNSTSLICEANLPVVIKSLPSDRHAQVLPNV